MQERTQIEKRKRTKWLRRAGLIVGLLGGGLASADRLRILTAAGLRDGDLTTMCYRYTIGYKTMRVRMPHCELKWEMSV